MRLLTRFVLTFGLAVLLVALAQAQILRVAAPADFAQIHLLRNDSVQKELKLSAAQVQKLHDLFAQNQESTRDVWQNHPPEEAGAHWQELSKQLREGALAVLTDAQRTRFGQI